MFVFVPPFSPSLVFNVCIRSPVLSLPRVIPLSLPPSTVQFYLRLGCVTSDPDTMATPVFLQFTTDGGVAWNTIEQFDFNRNSNEPTYIALHLPEKARTESTQIRWWQPTVNGTYKEDWAIDQVKGGAGAGRPTNRGGGTGSGWSIDQVRGDGVDVQYLDLYAGGNPPSMGHTRRTGPLIR
jgi:hypothetical protein